MTTTSEPAVRATAGLADLVGDPDDFFASTWGARSASYRCRQLPDAPAPADIWAQFDCGLFVSPYFTVLRDGRPVPLGTITETRKVQQQPRVGYADGTAVLDLFATGHTVRLNQPEDWHPGLKELVAAVREDLRAAVRSALFLAPAGAAGAPARTGDGHVIVVQLWGRTDWRTVGAAEEGADFALAPGDTLYVPAGWTYTGSVREEESLHLVLSVTRPGPRDLVRTAIAAFLESPAAAAVAGTHHYLTLDEKVAWLRRELAAHLTAQDSGELVRRAVRAHQGAEER